MMKVVVDGVTFTQMDNGHIWMEKDGKIISHASRSGYMNENQLKEYGKLKNRLHRLLKIDDELLERASKVQEAHMAAVEDWQEGDIDDCWIDENGNLCVKYESGKWWHYNELPLLTWW